MSEVVTVTIDEDVLDLIDIDLMKANLGAGDEEDETFTRLAASALAFIERSTDRHFLRKTVCQYEPCFKTTMFANAVPVHSIEIKYLDSNEDLQTLDEDDYVLLPSTHYRQKIHIVNIPNTATRPDAVQITLGVGPSDIDSTSEIRAYLPPHFWQAFDWISGQFYENQDPSPIQLNELAIGVKTIFNTLRPRNFV